MMDILGQISRRMRARKTERQLHALPDRMLKDIGLSRSEISYVARERTLLDRH